MERLCFSYETHQTLPAQLTVTEFTAMKLLALQALEAMRKTFGRIFDHADHHGPGHHS